MLFLRSVGIVGGDDSVCNSVLVQYVEVRLSVFGFFVVGMTLVTGIGLGSD